METGNTVNAVVKYLDEVASMNAVKTGLGFFWSLKGAMLDEAAA